MLIQINNLLLPLFLKVTADSEVDTSSMLLWETSPASSYQAPHGRATYCTSVPSILLDDVILWR